MRRRLVAIGAAVLVAIGAAVLPSGSPPAGAAGMTTHAWMAESAVDLVEAPDLRALLAANGAQVRSGARFPDGGYGPGNVYGEEAHWQRFVDVYADIIREKESCGDLTAPTGPCAAQIAHLMGIVAHGTGDEVWDWLFEPNSPDLDEYHLPEELAAFQDGGGQELVMDLVAIGVHHRPGGAPPPLPSVPDLLAAFAASGQQGVTAEQIAFGQTYIDVVFQAESGWVPTHLPGVLRDMPWMSRNLVTAPGGVQYAARAIAGQWDDMWARLRSQDPTTTVTSTYPADGQRRIPATGWVRTFQPGSHPGRGGARTRIAASLTYALPYRHPGGEPVAEQLPAGSFVLREQEGDVVVPLAPGYPKVVPYGPDAGTHTIDLQPASDLTPCTWYRVDVTDALLDADGDAVVPTSWTFRTGDADGTRCIDDPFAPDELWLNATYDDVFGGGYADDAGLLYWTGQLDRGVSRSRIAASLIASQRHRERLVRELYRGMLQRDPDPAGLAHWTEALRTRTTTQVRAAFFSSAEVWAHLGASPRPYVEGVFGWPVGRPPGAADVTYWAGRLRSGTSRGQVVRELFASAEGLRSRVFWTFADPLPREASAADLAYWVPIVKRSDERVLQRAIFASAEFYAHAQEIGG